MITIQHKKILYLKTFLFWLFLLPAIYFAQSTGTHITSNAQVGCRDYRDKEGVEDNGTSYENVPPSNCVRVCSGSNVTFTAQGQNISNVQWSASGGTIGTISGSGNTVVQVNWSTVVGAGALHAVITYTNGNTENQTVCIQKIISPTADFKMMNLDDSVCRNTLIYFDNLSLNNGGPDIVSYFWSYVDMSTGQTISTSTAFEPSYAFATAGNYEIFLTVTNKCGCSNTYSKRIRVTESVPVQINCASVVCEGSVEKYSVQDGCTDGEWKVIGGNIVSQNGNEIQVRWDQVDPAEGFGYVMYRSRCGCREWTTIKIPVILKTAKITGPTVICAGEQVKYTLPQWPTTNFQWNASGGNLIQNQQRNEILFQTSTPGTYTLWCSYNNTLLQCDGYAEITIIVEAPVTITGGTPEICIGSTQSFNASPNVPVTYSVTLDGNVIYTSPTTTGVFNYTFNTPGLHLVTATKQGGGCISNAIPIKVNGPPPAPAVNAISGEMKVCTNQPYTYTVSSVPSGVVPIWSVTNGTIQGGNSGNSVTVVFTPGFTTYQVQVRYQVLGLAGCWSKPRTLNVSAINLDTIQKLPHVGIYCPSSTHTFGVNLNGISPDSMEWRFVSANFGSFALGQGTENITVNFNEISSTASTQLILKVVKCGITKEIVFNVALYQLPTVNFVNVLPICLGSNLNFSVNQGTITSSTGVTFTFANQTSITVPFQSSGNYSFVNNNYITNSSGANVSQAVTVSYNGTNGCNYKPTATANFTVYPQTFITVSPVYNLVVCDPNNFTPYTLTANSSTGLTATTGWQWEKDGVDIPGATTNSYVLSGSGPVGLFGTYRVRATDQNGCVVYSQPIKVTQNCPPLNCNANPQISFTAGWSGCNTITASNLSYSGTPDEIKWVTNNILSLTSPQGQNSATFQTTIAGAHLVAVQIRYGNCWYSASLEVQKKYEPKFNVGIVCSGGGYNVTLFNTSTVFNLSSPVTYTFTSPGQSTQTGQTATYNNLTPGTYTFTMTMSSPGLPTCTTTQTVTLAPVPSVAISVPTSACQGEVITLNVPGAYSPLNTYTWSYDGTTYITNSSSAVITFNTYGPKDIKLRVTTPNNCNYVSDTYPVEIFSNVLGGTLFPDNILACVGSSPAIAFTNSGSGPAATQFIWMNGNTPVTGQTNSGSYTPTQSGSYWPILISAQGCRSYSMSSSPAIVTLKTTPFVSISAKSNICAGQSLQLTGIVTDNTLEYRWGNNAPPTGAWQSGPYPIVYNTTNLTAGTYTYYLEVRNPGTNGCVGSKSFTVTVSNPPAIPVISSTMQSCQPYEVLLTASGPSTGIYNWSNGMTGQSIVVNEGGAYSVTYTATSGCKVTSQIQVPMSLESLMWVFPTGCYNECRGDRYIIGPRGIFNSHEWQLFGANQQSGSNDYIYPYFINQSGTYQLSITNAGCTFTSGNMNFYPGSECGFEPECKLEAHVEGMKWDIDHYIMLGVINNFGSQPMTITISSLNGYGSYIPSIITIPAGGTYDMFANPIAFYPNSTYGGGADDVLFDAGNGCNIKAHVEIPQYGFKPVKTKSDDKSSIKISSMTIYPNPAQERVKVSFDTGNKIVKAKGIRVFDAMGSIRFSKELKTDSGDLEFEVSDWLQGVYIVIIHTDDKPLQGKLLKK